MKNLFLLLLLCALPAFAQSPPGGYGPGGGGVPSQQVAPNSNAVYLSTNCGTQTNCVTANFDVLMCFDGSVTLNSSTVTSAGQCNFTAADVGKYIFATNGCTSGGCGAYFGSGTKAVLPIGTITAINSAHSVTASTTATQTYASFSVIAYGHKDTAAIATAWADLIASGKCGTLVLPSGASFVDAGEFNTDPLNACSSTTVFQHYFGTMNNSSYEIVGQGAGSSVLIPTPDFNFASCTGTGILGCFGGAFGMGLRNWSIDGLNQSFTGSSHSVKAVVVTNGVVDSFDCNSWLTSDSAAIGIDLNQYSILINSQQSCGGSGGAVRLESSNNKVRGDFIGYNDGPALVDLDASATSMGNLYAPGVSSFSCIFLGNNGVSFSTTDDTCLLGSQTLTAFLNASNQTNDFITIRNMDFSSAVSASRPLFANGNGTVVHISGTKFGAATVDLTCPSSSTIQIFDDGGNSYAGTAGANCNPIIGSTSVSGVALTTAKIVASAGWGTGNALSAPLGQTQHVQVTMTNGTSTTANPTLTYTFPTPFWSAPASCHAQQVGGTNPQLLFLTTTPATTTSVVFTLQGTPTASDTMVISVDCGS